MNPTDPTSSPPLAWLEDPTASELLREDLLQFQQGSAQVPYDTAAGLARLQASIAATTTTTAAVAVATTSTLATKIVGTLIVGATLTGGGILWSNHTSNSAATPPTVERAVTSPQAAPNLSRLQPPPSEEEAQSATPDDLAPTPPPDAASTAELEMQALRHARKLLARHRAKAALQVLTKLEVRYPQGFLVPEREALMTVALHESGQNSKAKRKAQRFLATYPDSPMAPRIRSLLRK